jgi:hypothetical protein
MDLRTVMVTAASVIPPAGLNGDGTYSRGYAT